MKTLALETSGISGGVAVLDGERLLAERTLASGVRTAAGLVPAVGEVLQSQGWRMSDVQRVAVTQGPGSFTSLRIGVTTAKTLAYALNAEVLGVNTLEVIAGGAPAECQRLHVVLDAQRQQLFAGALERDSGGFFAWSHQTRIVDVSDWLETLQPGDVAAGPVLKKIQSQLPAGVACLAEEQWHPTAREVGRLAGRQYESGRRDDVWSLLPLYLRRSAAEEKADQKM